MNKINDAIKDSIKDSIIMSSSDLYDDFYQKFSKNLTSLENKLKKVETPEVYGTLVSAVGTTLEVHLPGVKIGDLCKIISNEDGIDLFAEVVALHESKVKILPFGSITNISKNCKIKRIGNEFQIKVGDFLLGKVVNGFGNLVGNIDGSSLNEDKICQYQESSIQKLAPDPFNRPLISEPLVTGVKSIDLFNTCGKGQRIGIFAGPGMGKTTLMGMIIRNSIVDVIVVALIGERGREVKEFIEIEMGLEAANKCVLVVATSDRPPVEQLKCAYVAQTIAEYFRDQGKSVLLFVDSITRFARAGREVGLSAGESIARGGFPASVFLSFPKLMERAGNNEFGSITAFYTVLMEGEDVSGDPIADEVKSIIDGHLILSKKLAERGQFPAIDNLKSLSRIADRIISDEHKNAARHIRLLLSQYEELEFLIRVGEYKAGNDAIADEAVNKHKEIITLLKQTISGKFDFEESLSKLLEIARH